MLFNGFLYGRDLNLVLGFFLNLYYDDKYIDWLLNVKVFKLFIFILKLFNFCFN